MTISYGQACSKSLVSVAGDSFKSSLVGIVAVEPEVMKAWAASEGIQVKDFNHNNVCHLFVSSFKKKRVCKQSDTDPTYNLWKLAFIFHVMLWFNHISNGTVSVSSTPSLACGCLMPNPVFSCGLVGPKEVQIRWNLIGSHPKEPVYISTILLPNRSHYIKYYLALACYCQLFHAYDLSVSLRFGVHYCPSQ